jgi:hypothetical protein
MTPDPHVTLATAEAIYLDACALVKIEKHDEGVSTNVMNVVVYWSTIPVFVSWVAFGEFVSVLGRITKSNVEGYLSHCRNLMFDIDHLRNIHRAEPTENPVEFRYLAGQLTGKYAKLGGGDLWHLLTVYELQKTHPGVGFLTYDGCLVKAARAEGLNVIDGKALVLDNLGKELQARHKWKDV